MSETLTPVTLVVPPGRFSPASRKSVETAVASMLKDGEKGALVALVDADGKEITGSVTAVLQTKRGWKMAATASWDGQVSGLVAVVRTWK